VSIILIILLLSVSVILLMFFFIPLALGCRYDQKMAGFIRWWFISASFEKSGATLKIGPIAIFSYARKKAGRGTKDEDAVQKRRPLKKKAQKLGRKDGGHKHVGFGQLWANRKVMADLISETLTLSKRIIGGIEVERLRLEIRKLPTDPAVMGYSYALYYGFIFPYLPVNSQIVFEPSVEKGKTNHFELVIRLYLYRLILAIIYFIIAIPKRGTYKFIRTFK